MANSSSGRTARLNVRISQENKENLARYKDGWSEAAYTDAILAHHFACLERDLQEERRGSR